MSAILGIFGPGAGAAPARAMLARMATRGAERSDLFVSDEVVLGVSRHGWECEDGFAGPAAVVHERDCICVSDATLYYRDDLRRALAAAGIEVDRAASPASLIIAAYRAWGAECAAKLEGDFAFILWDERARRVVASTELAGKRPLFRATFGSQLVVASSVTAIADHPACPDAYDKRVLAATIGQFWAANDETWHPAVREILPAYTLVREHGALPRVRAHWIPRDIGSDSSLSFEEAALQLRSLLEDAAEERLAPQGPTAVWMSGGWDSSSVFAAGRARLRSRGDDRPLLPVSLSYPVGDQGREDELIEAIAAHWQSPVAWIDTYSIPLVDDPARTAGLRDGPYAHAYEHWNRRLARESRGLGARVALDGNGGDQLFQVSDIFLVDLFRQGRWATLASEWRMKGGGRNWRGFLRHIVVPSMPAPARRAVERLRGRPFRQRIERIVPKWVRTDFQREYALEEWERHHLEQLRAEDEWRTESHRFVTLPGFGRALRHVCDFGRDAGVEVRSPLLDSRVVKFALTRPREERNQGLETKRLLRSAMRGLLPDHVLAPRTHRTGITLNYSDAKMRETMPSLLAEILAEPLLLAELGIVEPDALRAAWPEFLSTGASHVSIPLFLTLQTELWLRARRNEATGRFETSDAVAGHRSSTGDVRDTEAVEMSV